MLKRKFSNKPDAENPEDYKPESGSENPLDNSDAENDDATDMGEQNKGDEPELEDADNAEPGEFEVEITALQNELCEAQDKYLRMAAEFDNYRKRTLREKTELIQTAGESLLKDILPLVDDFERGLDAADKSEDMDAVKTGMHLIYNKLREFLLNHGVKEISSMNEPFNADWHEAVTNIPAPSEDMKGKIVDVIQKGYTLQDKIIRYPKVVVGE